MKKYLILLTAFVLTLSSCTKDDPIAEVDQEELSTATLTFTPVERINNNGEITYKTIEGENAESIKFEGKQLLPPTDAHLHLHVGETYKMELKTTDFAGRPSENTFLSRADTHQAFLLGTPTGAIDFVYGDDNVGVTAYITVLKQGETSIFNYILRHLNKGVKDRIKASDWNNVNYSQFTGDNDLNLKFSVHLVDHSHEGH